MLQGIFKLHLMKISFLFKVQHYLFQNIIICPDPDYVLYVFECFPAGRTSPRGYFWFVSMIFGVSLYFLLR